MGKFAVVVAVAALGGAGWAAWSLEGVRKDLGSLRGEVELLSALEARVAALEAGRRTATPPPALPGAPRAPEAEAASLVDVLIDLGAGAIVRARLSEGQAEIQALARTEQLRNALLSSISHDLRTPLAAILASASSLKEFGDQFPPDVRDDLLATITEEAERLNLFVANLLDMTRLEGGALRVEAGPFSVREVIDRLTARLARRLGARRLVTKMADGGLIARGDPVLLEQALGNVLENAIRFSPDGSEILLTVHGGDRVEIEVTDAGPGVPEAELDLIFEKFFRSPQALKHSQGTGLGLSIARGLTEAMGGAVHARPRADARGLVVALRLPGEETP